MYKPEDSTEYWYIDIREMRVRNTWNVDKWDKSRIEAGNCFETEQEAEVVFNKIKEVLKNG